MPPTMQARQGMTMTPNAADRPAVLRSPFWAAPIVRIGRRKAVAAPARLPATPQPVDEGEDLLRRLREAGL